MAGEQGNFRIGAELDVSPFMQGLRKLYGAMKQGAQNASKNNAPLKRTFADLQVEARKIGFEWDKTTRKFKKGGDYKSLKDLKKKLNELGQEFDDVGDKAEDLFGQVTQGFKGVFQGIPQGIGQSIGNQLTEPFRRLPGAIGGVVKSYSDVERAIRATISISGESQEKFDGLTNSMDQLAAATKFTTIELAEASTALARAGFSTEEIEAALPGIALGASATGESLESMADTVLGSLQTMGLAATDTADFVDVLTVAANNSNTSVTELGEGLKYAAPIAASLGVPIEDLSAVMALLANNGIRASTAGTTLRMGLNRLAQASSSADSPMGSLSRGTANMAEVLAQMGVVLTDVNGELLPMPQLLGRLKQGFDNLNQTDRAVAAKVLFGSEAGSGFIALLRNSGEEIAEMFRKTNNAAGTAEQAAQDMMSGLSGALDLLESATSSALNALGKIGGDLFLPIIRGATDLLNVFNNLNPTAKQFVVATAALGAGVIAVTAAINLYNLALAAQNALLIASGQSAMPGLIAQMSSLGARILPAAASATTALNTAMAANISLNFAGTATSMATAMGAFVVKALAGAKAIGALALAAAPAAIAIGAVVSAINDYRMIMAEATAATQQGRDAVAEIDEVFKGVAQNVPLASNAFAQSSERIGVVQARLDQLRVAYQGLNPAIKNTIGATTGLNLIMGENTALGVSYRKEVENREIAHRNTTVAIDEARAKLKELAAAESQSTESAEEYKKAKESLVGVVKGEIDLYEQQITALNRIKVTNGELTDEQQASLDQLERLIRERKAEIKLINSASDALATNTDELAANNTELATQAELTEVLTKAQRKANEKAQEKIEKDGAAIEMAKSSVVGIKEQIEALTLQAAAYEKNSEVSETLNAKIEALSSVYEGQRDMAQELITELTALEVAGVELSDRQQQQYDDAVALVDQYADLEVSMKSLVSKKTELTSATDALTQSTKNYIAQVDAQLDYERTKSQAMSDSVKSNQQYAGVLVQTGNATYDKIKAQQGEIDALVKKERTQGQLTEAEKAQLDAARGTITQLRKKFDAIKAEELALRFKKIETRKGNIVEKSAAIAAYETRKAMILKAAATRELTNAEKQKIKESEKAIGTLKGEIKAERERITQEAKAALQKKAQIARQKKANAERKAAAEATKAETEAEKSNTAATADNTGKTSSNSEKLEENNRKRKEAKEAKEAEYRATLQLNTAIAANTQLLATAGNTLSQLRQRQVRLNTELNSAKASYGENSIQAARLKVEMDNLSTEMSGVVSEAESAAKAMGEEADPAAQGLANRITTLVDEHKAQAIVTQGVIQDQNDLAESSDAAADSTGDLADATRDQASAQRDLNSANSEGTTTTSRSNNVRVAASAQTAQFAKQENDVADAVARANENISTATTSTNSYGNSVAAANSTTKRFVTVSDGLADSYREGTTSANQLYGALDDVEGEIRDNVKATEDLLDAKIDLQRKQKDGKTLNEAEAAELKEITAQIENNKKARAALQNEQAKQRSARNSTPGLGRIEQASTRDPFRNPDPVGSSQVEERTEEIEIATRREREFGQTVADNESEFAKFAAQMRNRVKITQASIDGEYELTKVANESAANILYAASRQEKFLEQSFGEAKARDKQLAKQKLKSIKKNELAELKANSNSLKLLEERARIEIRQSQDRSLNIQNRAAQDAISAQADINAFTKKAENERKLLSEFQARIDGQKSLRDADVAKAAEARDKELANIDRIIQRQTFLSTQKLSKLQQQETADVAATDRRLKALDSELFKVQLVSNARIKELQELTPSEEKLAALQEKKLRARAKDSSLSKEERLQAKAQLERAEREKEIAKERAKIEEIEQKIQKEQDELKLRQIERDKEIVKLRERLNSTEQNFAARRQAVEDSYQSKVRGFNSDLQEKLSEIQVFRERGLEKLLGMEDALFDATVKREQSKDTLNRESGRQAREQDAIEDRFAGQLRAIGEAAQADNDATSKRLSNIDLLQHSEQVTHQIIMGQISEEVAHSLSGIETKADADDDYQQSWTSNHRLRADSLMNELHMEEMISKERSKREGGRGGRNGGPNRFLGGPVSGAHTYTVNEIGQEAFLSNSGKLSMINAPSYGQWRAPSSGQVIPADIAADLTLPKFGAVNTKGVPTSAGAATANAKQSGGMNALERVARALLGGMGGDKVTNNVTIQSETPVKSASDMLVSLAKNRRRRYS